ncbi:MAG: HAD family hydrolase [Deltaproteobacteria bacterium]|nr:HAD family hydrolase [Deltaproteobacteria bacterium]
MQNWLSVLQEFPVPEPAVTVPGGDVPPLEPLPRVVLFDVYGTLVCPHIGDLDDQARLASSEDSFLATAERFGFSKDVAIKWHRWFFEAIALEHATLKEQGISPAEVQVDQIWADMIGMVGGEVTGNQPRMFAAYREMLANPVRPFSGAVEALRTLKERGVGLGIVSNSQFYTMPVLGLTLGINPEEFFDPKLIFLSFQLGFSKPSPYFFRLVRTAVLHLGLRPEEVLVVGNDRENDVLAAEAHGLQAVLFHGNDQSVRLGKGGRAGTVITNYQRLLTACGL